jgi:hypothetical protein
LIAFTIANLPGLPSSTHRANPLTPPCYTSYPTTGPKPLADTPSSSPCPDMHPSHLTLLFGTPTLPRTLTVEITAALHMASLIDAYRSHSGCILPLNPPPACEGPPLQHCPGYVSTHLRAWWAFGLQDTSTPDGFRTTEPRAKTQNSGMQNSRSVQQFGTEPPTNMPSSLGLSPPPICPAVWD